MLRNEGKSNMKFTNAMAGVLLLGAVAACSSTDAINQAANTAPPSSAFNQQLQTKYVELARSEEAQSDWRSGFHFADKAASAAAGNQVGPDPLEWRDLEGDKMLVAAHATFQEKMAAGAATANPEAAAEAQVALDCWMEQKEECWQPEDIAACRKRFEDAIAALMGPAPEPAAPAVAGSYIVFFDWDSAELTPEAIEIIQTAALDAKNTGVARLLVVGHADRSGAASYNIGLSLRRSNAVKGGLIQSGIAESAISVEAKGETDPLVPTDDGVREPQNRRVEIFFQ